MGTQQFASGLSPIDTEIITSTRDNTQTLISKGEWLEKYQNMVHRSQINISPSTTVTVVSVVGEGYFSAIYAKLAIGTPTDYHRMLVEVDGLNFFGGSWDDNALPTGLVTRDFLRNNSANLLALSQLIPTGTGLTNSLSRIQGIVGPNNVDNFSGPILQLEQPVFFKTSLKLIVSNNTVGTDTVEYVVSGAVK